MNNKKILLTGATGLIGKELLHPLLEKGYTIYAITRKPYPNTEKLIWLCGDLFDTKFIKECCQISQADILIHLAWKVTRDYANSNENFAFLSSSITLLQEFHAQGGKQIFISGSYSEYEFSSPCLTEQSPLAPKKMLYTFCKHELHNIAEMFCKQNNLIFSYGRIFNVFGHNEDDIRLSKQVLNNLSKNKEIIIKSGPLYKDYLYSKEVALAIIHIMEKQYNGVINICSGKAITIKTLSLAFAEKLQKKHLVKFIDDFGNQPSLVYGNNTILTNILGYHYKYTMEQGIENVVSDFLNTYQKQD